MEEGKARRFSTGPTSPPQVSAIGCCGVPRTRPSPCHLHLSAFTYPSTVEPEPLRSLHRRPELSRWPSTTHMRTSELRSGRSPKLYLLLQSALYCRQFSLYSASQRHQCSSYHHWSGLLTGARLHSLLPPLRVTLCSLPAVSGRGQLLPPGASLLLPPFPSPLSPPVRPLLPHLLSPPRRGSLALPLACLLARWGV